MNTKKITINCPVCNSIIHSKSRKRNEIIVCPVCNNSIFVRKDKDGTKLVSFKLNIVPEDEFLEEEESKNNFNSMVDLIDDIELD